MKKILIFLFCILSFFKCEKSELNDYDKYGITIKAECKHGECVTDQFKLGEEYFAYIAGDEVNLRFKPDISSQSHRLLHTSEQVTILYLMDSFEVINGRKGRWAFVQLLYEPIKGWVFDYYLATLSKFQDVKNWKYKYISEGVGDYTVNYSCTRDGKFTANWGAAGGDSIEYGNYKGKIKKYLKVIYFQKNIEDDFPQIFVLDDDHVLRPQFIYDHKETYFEYKVF